MEFTVCQAISVEMYRQDYIQKIIFYLLILLRTQFTGTFELTMRKQWSILIISMWKYFYFDWNIYVRYNVDPLSNREIHE